MGSGTVLILAGFLFPRFTCRLWLPRPLIFRNSDTDHCVTILLSLIHPEKMAETTPTPFRHRPNLHLSLTQLAGSPRALGRASTLPFGTPLTSTTYSPFRSAGLKPPTPYGGPMQFTPRYESRRYFETYSWYRIKRMLNSKPLWFLLALLTLTVWWFHGGSDELSMAKLDAKRLGKDLFPEGRTKNLQFFPASNPKIHVRSSRTA